MVNRTKIFSLGNVCKAIEFREPENEDIIVLIDADDMLAHNDVLQYLCDVYSRTKCWMTYGSFYNCYDSTRRDKVCRFRSDE